MFGFAVSLTVLLAVSTIAKAPQGQPQGGGGGGRGQAVAQAPVADVSFDRLLKSAEEPQNWLMYSGSYLSQRYSALNQITTANVKDLDLKWVHQTRSTQKHEVTPLVVNGTM